jgi:hypothetical protein
MLEAIIIVGLLAMILAILLWPQRSPYVRRVTNSDNGQHYGKVKEPSIISVT